MKIRSLYLRKIFIPVLFVAMSAILFISCKKNRVEEPQPAAGLMVYNLIPDLPGVGFAIDGINFLPPPVTYGGYSGPYRAVFPGNRNLETYDIRNSNTLAASPVSLRDSGFYSLFAMGANESYRNVFVEDNLQSIPSGTGNAFVRFVNGIPDSSESNVLVYSGADEVVNTSMKYSNVTGFQPVTPGDVSVNVVSADHLIDASRTVSLKKDGIYTFLLMGIPTAVDTAQEVKITYVQNALVSP